MTQPARPLERGFWVEGDKLRQLLDRARLFVARPDVDENRAELDHVLRLFPELPAYCWLCGRETSGDWGEFDGVLWRPLCAEGASPTCREKGLDAPRIRYDPASDVVEDHAGAQVIEIRNRQLRLPRATDNERPTR